MSQRDEAGTLFEFLHMEMVHMFMSAEEEEETANNDVRDFVHVKLEKIGFSCGQSLAERLTQDTPRMTDQLEVIKFICKDFWMNLFQKQVDNLRTNHKGVYVLQDNKFQTFAPIANGTQYIEQMSPFLAMPCGLIRGALAALGHTATVHADVVNMPACTFQIRIQRMETEAIQ
ncbi:hypothetical protein SARC_00698 [Sphaeroforma arctica JP610]|uniref:Trafficking protein particle complex subunit 6B n=1 Tax=Sphaeroforma arctica JP610 TaxID=667725 RepID=A0A0L0GDU1_9EUKA|nr:hypothetical protein SARC_00698 [Sphaeroforma arctica JP610]KNC87170.1 hypothetical protein SARC_00698 [Sphaeroforma arctica JP610]|eukprot:XP_014161072.1 hypothetical protein SARC_00698 [Sphaeroforma arctica JP610]